MGKFERDLDRWITGNWGEDQFPPLPCPRCGRQLPEELTCGSCDIVWDICESCGDITEPESCPRCPKEGGVK